jgi:hypothetical protein
MTHKLVSSAILTTTLGLTACGGDSDNDNNQEQGPNNGISTAVQATIDASAGGMGAGVDDPENKYSYFSFATGTEVELQDDEAEHSNAWDIAFKRTSIIVNGNAATAALVAKQERFYDQDGNPIKDSFINANADTEAQAFIDITAEGITNAEFKTDEAVPALTDWYTYNFMTHVVTANTDNFYLIQNAENDNVSIFNMKAITTAGRVAASYRVQFFNNEAAAGTDFSFPQTGTEFVADFTSQTEICYDLDTHSQLDCASNPNTWDLRLDNSFQIWLNGGIHGTGNAKTTTPDSFANISAKTSVSPYELLADSKTGIFTDSATKWSAYGINNQHKMWPNYRVYAVESHGQQYKLRILSYYAPMDSVEPAAGTSGVITFEYEQL